MERRRGARIGLAAVLATAALAGTARADGLPAGGLDVGTDGVAAPSSPFRYVTLRAGDGTLVARTAQQGGQVMFSRRITGRFSIPAVAYDGSASGLSAEEQTLVLIRPRTRFPQRRTVIAIVGTPRLEARIVRLRGDFSFDAISPNGRWAYLIHYLDPRDPVDYELRAYDTRKLRLVAEPVVDPSEPDEQMGGIPLSRAVSADGRWAYTLYDAKEPFVHALDTAGRTAVCIDLPQLAGRPLQGMRLAAGDLGDELAVTRDAEPVLLIDPRSFSVRSPAQAPGPVAADGSVFPWAELGFAVLVAAAVIWLGVRLNRSPRSDDGRAATTRRP